MSFTTILNNPWERHTVTYPWVYWDGAFSDEELQKMCDYFAEQGVERGTTVGAAKPDAETGEVKIDQAPNEKVRKSNVKFHNRNENTAWIYDRFNWVIQQLNEQFYGFDLYGYDTMQYTEYESVEGGKYDFHMDTILGQNVPHDMQTQGTRKMSIVMCLNESGVDFEGGQFQINNGQEADAETIELKKGRIIAFPSWMLHRVAPTTSGKRKSLVIWVLGPKFK
jgi:PKHD-type hydroxylase